MLTSRTEAGKLRLFVHMAYCWYSPCSHSDKPGSGCLVAKVAERLADVRGVSQPVISGGVLQTIAYASISLALSADAAANNMP